MAPHWITTYGSTVEEAVDEALKQLKASKDEVEIVVEEQPRDGFLGLWRLQARVRVRRLPQEAIALAEDSTAEETASEPEKEAPAMPSRPGTIIVQDGQVYVNPSTDEDEQLMIRPGEHVEVFVNGELLDGPQVVGADDVIEIRAVDTPPETTIDVHIAEDEYTASISVIARQGFRYKIVNSPPGKSVTVRAEPSETLPPVPPTVEQLEAALSKAGVVYGISREALEALVQEFIENPSAATEPKPVAFGKPDKPTLDERVELYFDPAARVRSEIETDDNRADLLGLFKLSSVSKGEQLAVVLPGKKGEPGYTVTGREVPVTDPRPVQLNVGAGAELLADGRTVVATRGGRPTYVRNTISVHPQHTVKGDVDPETGHVEFDGDVVVKGNVSDSMRVVSKGTVSIGVGIASGFVEAWEGIAVGRGIVRSTVIAGARYTRLFQLIGYLQPLAKDLSEIVQAARGFRSNPESVPAAFRGTRDGAFVRWLLDGTYRDVPKRVQALHNLVYGDDPHRLDQGPFDADVLELVDSLHELLVGLGPLSIDSIEQLANLELKLAVLVREFEDQPKELFDVTADFIHNSTVLAAGRIVVRSGGCAYSRLWSGTGVSIEAGVFRGSTVTVNTGDIVVKEAGSRSAAPTRLEIVDRGVIKASLIHPGVTVAIGNRSHTFRREALDVRVRLVDGELQIHGAV